MLDSGVAGSVVSALVTEPFDNMALTYVDPGDGSRAVGTITYSLGGVDFALVTLTYDGTYYDVTNAQRTDI